MRLRPSPDRVRFEGCPRDTAAADAIVEGFAAHDRIAKLLVLAVKCDAIAGFSGAFIARAGINTQGVDRYRSSYRATNESVSRESTPGVRFATNFDALARQNSRIDAANAGELNQALGVDRGHHHANFIHVGGDHHAEFGLLRPALGGGDVAQGIDLEDQ